MADPLAATGPVLALDVGGTKLAAALVDRAGAVAAARVVPTPVTDDPELVWGAVDGLLTDVLTAGGTPAVAGVGAGCGGPMEWPAGRVSPLNMPSWRGFPLRERLAERFAGRPVRVHNDAVCVALAEHWRGAGRGADAVLGMVVSTGVGGGLLLGGRLVSGPTGNAGHVGHVVVEPAGPPCGCGGRGCLEAVARGPAVAAWAVEHGWRPAGEPTARALADAARGGDPVAVAAYDRAGRALGRAVASVAAVCDLQVVSIGGGLAQAGPLLFDPLAAALREHARLGFLTGLRVRPAELGQAAGLVGAAALLAAGDRYWDAAAG